MDLVTIINNLDQYMERTTKHYKQKNVDAIIYNNTNNHTITVNEDTYTPLAILLYNTQDQIELSIQTYNIQHPYTTDDIETLVIT